MRRKEKMITDVRELETILHNGTVCRIAMVDNGTPYLVPLNYGYRDNTIYFHSAHQGRKIDILIKNPSVCFEIETDVHLMKSSVPCNWGMQYKSIIGYGTVRILDSEEEKNKALNIIMHHNGSPEPAVFNDRSLDSVTVCSIIIEKITGKKSGY